MCFNNNIKIYNIIYVNNLFFEYLLLDHAYEYLIVYLDDNTLSFL